MTVVIYLVCGILALLCAAAAVYMGRWTFQLWKTNVQFQQRGVVVKGVVDNQHGGWRSDSRPRRCCPHRHRHRFHTLIIRAG
jgi:hypothetical protein